MNGFRGMLVAGCLSMFLMGCQSQMMRDLGFVDDSAPVEQKEEQAKNNPQEQLPGNQRRVSQSSSVAFAGDPDVKAKRALLDNLTDKCENLRNQSQRIEEDIKALSKRKELLAKQVQDVKLEQQQEVRERKKLEFEKEKLVAEKDKLLTENKILMKHLDDTKDSAANIEKTLGDKKSALNDLDRSIATRQNEMDAATKKVVVLQKEIAALERRKNELLEKKRELEALTANFDTVKKRLQASIKHLEMSMKGLADSTTSVEPLNSPPKVDKPKPIKKPEVKKVVSEKTLTPLPADGKAQATNSQVEKASANVSSPTNESKKQPAEEQVVRATSAAKETIKRVECPAVADSYLIEVQPDTNRSSATGLVVGYSKDFRNLRAVFKFDLKEIPEGAVIKKAVMKLYCYKHFKVQVARSVGAHEITGDWTETSVTWNDVVFNPTPEMVVSMNRPDDWYGWELTKLVKQWYSKEHANFGVILKADPEGGTESNFFYLNSREQDTDRPVLMIEFTEK